MKNLILKDIRLLGFFNIFLLGLPLALGIIALQPDQNYQAILIYFFAALVPVYLLVVRLSINDMKSNSDSLLISLPLKKLDIVKSRYLSILMYLSFILGALFLSSYIGRFFLGTSNQVRFHLKGVFFTASPILLFLSINIPFQYFDPRKTQIFNSIFYIALVLAPSLLMKVNINPMDNSFIKGILSMPLELLALGMFLASLLIYGLSLFVSKIIYEGKEF